jgi:hypothetical protein
MHTGTIRQGVGGTDELDYGFRDRRGDRSRKLDPLFLSRTMKSAGRAIVKGNALDLPHHARLAQRAFERIAVPFGGVCSGLIGALQKIEQRLVRRRRGAYGIVGQDEFAQCLVEERSLRLDLRGAEARRFGIGVGIERGIVDRTATRPEAGAALLVRIGFAGDSVRQVRHAAGMAGRGPHSL